MILIWIFALLLLGIFLSGFFSGSETGFYRASRVRICLLYTSPSPRDQRGSRMPSSA